MHFNTTQNVVIAWGGLVIMFAILLQIIPYVANYFFGIVVGIVSASLIMAMIIMFAGMVILSSATGTQFPFDVISK